MKFHLHRLSMVVLIAPFFVFAEPLVFHDAKLLVHSGGKNPRFVQKKGDLSFEDESGMFRFSAEGTQQSFETSYGKVRRVVFDESVRPRGGDLGNKLGGIVGAIIESKTITELWMYLEYGTADSPVVKCVILIPPTYSTSIRDKASAVFGDRVVITKPQLGDGVASNTLPDVKSKHTAKYDFKNHPQPELKADKALVVVLCRTLGENSLQVKFHANERVILVNNTDGTYGFTYLDPGEYRLASQSVDSLASALQLNLEAGKGYYFLQNLLNPGTGFAQLSQNSPEFVMYMLGGAYHSLWERKPGK